MGEIFFALTEAQKEALVHGDFFPTEIVEITVKRKRSQFSEDISRLPVRQRFRKRTRSSPKPPSEKYKKSYVDFKSGKCAADAQSVLGCYFIFYREEFGEEDPEWMGNACVKPLYNINQMAHAVCDGNFADLIEFVEMLFPLWAEQLRKGASFPSTRPTIDTFFVRRKIWAQRFLLERRWTS